MTGQSVNVKLQSRKADEDPKNFKDVKTQTVKLEGIASDPKGKRVAALNGELVKEGATVGVVRVVAIDKRSVKLMIGGKEYTLNLFEEGGAQGE